MKLSRVRLIFFTLLLTIGVLWLTQPSEYGSSKIDIEAAPASKFSWQTSGTTSWNLNIDSPNQQSIIKSQEIVYLEKTQTSNLKSPEVFIIDSNTLTTINSKTGQTTEDNVIHFNDSVLLTHKDTNTQEVLNLRTEQLTYNVEQQQLTSEVEVNVDVDNNRLNGIGLNADLKAGDYEVRQKVTSILYPDSISQKSADQNNTRNMSIKEKP